ncbi:MAG: diadenylate cyclase CdaA [Candidatus Kapaibacterium sp.]|jgi:diadenylate cyclase
MIELFHIGFLTITLVDILDIALSAFVLYWVYRALRGTVAIQILIGLVVLIAISFVVNSANMKALSWMVNAITGIWLLAFIVLFQPELRRLLTALTRTRLFRLFVRSSLNQTIDEVIDAVREFSEKHVGALIVFSKLTNIRTAVESGISLQAVVSTELLTSIFNVRSPLHDGAVILDGQIVVAARCILPLSNTMKLGTRNLGTRHRAALGLSEVADVVVLVVSEETGVISVAVDGDMQTEIPISSLRAVLASHLSVRTTVGVAIQELKKEDTM